MDLIVSVSELTYLLFNEATTDAPFTDSNEYIQHTIVL